jgi:hypothetical protein
MSYEQLLMPHDHVYGSWNSQIEKLRHHSHALRQQAHVRWW